jgi:SAM-dependent methyltransferase
VISARLLERRTNVKDVKEDVQALVDRMTQPDSVLRVLEAGCGSNSKFRLAPHAHITGIDISREQLAKNNLLHEKILGDIQTYPLEASSFDIIFCWDVLEHLEHPENALKYFARAIRDGGMGVLGAPGVGSLIGVISKYTPHWFHIAVYRYWLGYKDAGKAGCPPFRTFLKNSMSPCFIEDFANESQLSVEALVVYEGAMQIKERLKHRSVDLGLSIFGPLIKTLSFRRIDPSVTDFVMVLRKLAKAEVTFPPTHQAPGRGVFPRLWANAS